MSASGHLVVAFVPLRKHFMDVRLAEWQIFGKFGGYARNGITKLFKNESAAHDNISGLLMSFVFESMVFCIELPLSLRS